MDVVEALELTDTFQLIYNQVVSAQEQMVRSTLCLEYRSTKREGFNGISAMDDEIHRQRMLLAKLGSMVRVHSSTCKTNQPSQVRFDELKSEIRRISEWLTDRKNKLEDEYKSGTSFTEAFYDQLLYYADCLEEKYSPYTKEVRRLVEEEREYQEGLAMEEDNSQYEDDHFEIPPVYSDNNNDQVVVVEEEEGVEDFSISFDSGNGMETRRIILRETMEVHDTVGHVNPRLSRMEHNLASVGCAIHQALFNLRSEEQVD